MIVFLPIEEKDVLVEDVMTDIYLLDLAEKIGFEWSFLANGLGFKLPELQHIMSNYPHSFVDQIHTMLVKWRQRQPPRDMEAAVRALAEGMKICHREDLADLVLTLLQ